MRRGVCLCTDTMPVCYANFRDGLQKLHEHNLDMNWLEQRNELLFKSAALLGRLVALQTCTTRWPLIGDVVGTIGHFKLTGWR